MTADDLAALHAQCFVVPRPWGAAEFSDILAGPGAYLVHLPQGFVVGRAVAGEAELLTIAVAPDAQRGGLGAQLVAQFEDGARKRGASEAFLEVAEDNTPARALYAKAGYAEAGRRKAYYRNTAGGTVDALVLRRSLTLG